MNFSSGEDVDCPFNISEAAFCESNFRIFDICRNRCIYEWVEYPLPTGYPNIVMYGLVFPILLALVIVANVFVVLVLSRKHMASPTNLVILYMAIAELFVGLVPFPFTFFYYTLGNYLKKDIKVWWCYMFDILFDGLPPTCHNIANWLTVILALQRFIYIHYPLRASTLCTVSNVRRASVFVVVLSCLFGFQPFIDMEYTVFEGYRAKLKYDRNSTSGMISGYFVGYHYTACMGRPTATLLLFGEQLYYNIYYWPRVVLFIGLPCFLLISLNFLLVLGIRKANRRRARLLMENRQREARRQTESNTTSVMLVIIVSIFLIVNVPQGFFLAVFVINETFKLQITWLDIGSSGNDFIRYFMLVDNMLIIASYPINFAIYCSMSSQFRETFKQFFCTEIPPVQVVRQRFSRNSHSRGSLAGSARPTNSHCSQKSSINRTRNQTEDGSLAPQVMSRPLLKLRNGAHPHGSFGDYCQMNDWHKYRDSGKMRTESLPLMNKGKKKKIEPEAVNGNVTDSYIPKLSSGIEELTSEMGVCDFIDDQLGIDDVIL